MVNKAMGLHDEGEKLQILRSFRDYLNKNIHHLEYI